jgi:hypothetical protein
MEMDTLTAFGLFAVSAMLVCYAFEDYSPWFVLAFAGSCAFCCAYGFMQGAWLFGVVEAIWSLVALRRWRQQHAAYKQPALPGAHLNRVVAESHELEALSGPSKGWKGMLGTCD